MRGAASTPVADAHRVGYVLVYGTLCASEPAHARLGLRKSLTYCGRRRVPGTLYDLGPYPALVLGAGEAPAELYRIDDARVLTQLDRYEGYDPRAEAASLFVRTSVRVPRHAQSAAASLTAWVYVYNGSVAGRADLGGRSWTEYRRRRDASAPAFAGSPRRRR